MDKEEIIKEKNGETLEEIKRCYKKGTLAPFIGAGFSSNIQGSPTWQDFIKKLSKNIGKEENFLLEEFEKGQNSYLRASEYYIYEKGKQTFQANLGNIFKKMYATNWDDFLEKVKEEDEKTNITIWENFIREISKDLNNEEGLLLEKLKKDQNAYSRVYEYYTYIKGKKALQEELENTFKKIMYKEDEQWTIHNKLVGLKNISLIYTTNWDDFLEKAFEGNNKKIITIYQQNDFPQLKRNNLEDKKIVIKFHGHYEKEYLDTIIVSELDYYKRMLEMNFLDLKFHYDLTHYNFIFMGFSFDDMNINYLLNAYYQVLERFDTTIKFPDHYILTIESSSNLTLNLIKRKGIMPYYLLSDETIKRFEDKKKAIWGTYHFEKVKDDSPKGLESIAKKREKELDKLKDDKLIEIRKAYQLFFEELKQQEEKKWL